MLARAQNRSRNSLAQEIPSWGTNRGSHSRRVRGQGWEGAGASRSRKLLRAGGFLDLKLETLSIHHLLGEAKTSRLLAKKKNTRSLLDLTRWARGQAQEEWSEVP